MRNNTSGTLRLVFISLVFTIAVAGADAFASEGFKGQKFIRNFPPDIYNASPQNWEIIQNKQGIIYVANSYGLLEFDGREWTIFPSMPGLNMRSIAIDQQGVIFYGATNCFGYMKPNEDGFLNFHSLKDKLPEGKQDVRIVMDVHVMEHKIYFRSSNNLYVYDTKSDQVNAIAPQTSFHRSYAVNNEFFIHQPGLGLFKLVDQQLEAMPAGEMFANNLIYLLLPWENKFLVGSNREGLQIYDPASAMQEDVLKKFPNDAAEYLEEHSIYKGVWLYDSLLAVATNRGGMVVLNTKGQIVDRVDKSTGLQDESVWDIFPDANNKIWMALNNGISMKELNHPMMYWDQKNGLDGGAVDVVKFDSRVYVGNLSGAFVMQSNQFRPIRGIRDITWQFLVVPSHRGDQLFAATRSGLFQIFGDRAVPILDGEAITSLNIHKDLPDLLFAGTNQGVMVLERRNDIWYNNGKIEGLRGNYRDIFIDDNMNIWLRDLSKGVSRAVLNIENILMPHAVFHHLGEEDPMFANVIFFEIDNQLVFSSNTGLFRFDASTESFYSDCFLGVEFCKENVILSAVTQMSDGRVWLYKRNYYNYSRTFHVFEKSADGVWAEIQPSCSCFPQLPVVKIYETAQSVWFAEYQGLYKFDKSFQKLEVSHPDVFIKTLISQSDTLYLNHLKNNAHKSLGLELPYGSNFIEFNLASPSFSQVSSSVQYSYMLEGFDTHWSEWTPGHLKYFNNLPAGQYRFLYRVDFGNGDYGEGEPFAFSVKRPLFLRWYAFLFYAMMVAGVILLGNLVYTRNLRRKNDLLQRVVEERTAEIVAQRDEIQKKNETLEQQQEEIISQSHQLENINKSLEDRIVSELSKNRKKDLMLIQQSRQAAMGEMIGNIAHQWRQPLNAVAVIVQNIHEAWEYKEITDQYMNEKVRKCMEIIQYMSQTIDDFRNFFKPEKSPHVFNVNRVVEKSISFIEASLKQNNIHMSFSASEDIYIKGYANEYAQVLLNLLNNSRDALIANRIEHPTIELSLFQKDGVSVLSVADNGGGIPEGIKDKIFTPYFSTKQPGDGTGLGLYMSKTIIEKNMQGSLTYESTREGVEFIVTV